MALLGFGAGAGAGYAHYLGALNNVPIMTVGPTTLMHILCIMIGGLLGSTQRSDYVRIAGSGMSTASRLAAAAGRLLAASSSKISSTDRPDT